MPFLVQILQSESPKSTRAMYNKKHRASKLSNSFVQQPVSVSHFHHFQFDYLLVTGMFVGQQIGDVVDIDGAQSQSAAYDPTYGWSIWMNQRNLEVLQRDRR